MIQHDRIKTVTSSEVTYQLEKAWRHLPRGGEILVIVPPSVRPYVDEEFAHWTADLQLTTRQKSRIIDITGRCVTVVSESNIHASKGMTLDFVIWVYGGCLTLLVNVIVGLRE